MAFIGNSYTTQDYFPRTDYFSGDGSRQSFVAGYPIASVEQVQAVINNVPVAPNQYQVVGNAVVFNTTPTMGQAIYIRYTSPITQVNQVAFDPRENISYVGTPFTGTYNWNVLASTISINTASATSNFVVNFVGDTLTTISGYLSTNKSLTVVLGVTNGATAYYPTSFLVNGVAPAFVRFPSGVAPATGFANSIDLYTFSIWTDAAGAFTVIGNQSSYK